jgi:hypothetical protein
MNGVVPVPNLAHDLLVTVDYFPHSLLNRFQVIYRKWLGSREVIEKTMLNDWAYGDLRSRKQLLHGFRHDMGSIMPQEFQSGLILRRQNSNLAVFSYLGRKILEIAVNLYRQCRPSQARTNIGSEFSTGYGFIKIPHTAIGQGDGNHGKSYVRSCSVKRAQSKSLEVQVKQLLHGIELELLLLDL